MDLHIIEPTLADQTGHCYGYIESLLASCPNNTINWYLWFDVRGGPLLQSLSQPCQFVPYFRRRWRKLQLWWCLKKLIRANVAIFIPTAGRLDLLYLDKLLKKYPYRRKIFLHFHQFTCKPKKISLLERIAKIHSQLVIMVPTKRLLDIFTKAAFQYCELAPCPVVKRGKTTQTMNVFKSKKIIYAGAARSDKGFPQVVALLEYIQKEQLAIAAEVQISPPHNRRYDEDVKQALLRLKQLDKKHITLYQETLSTEDYKRLFQGGICLLLYDPSSYHDKFSGVALDAFCAGVPLISVGDTWASQMIRRFNSGVVLENCELESVVTAIEVIYKNYIEYQKNAELGGAILSCEHSPDHTLAILQKHII